MMILADISYICTTPFNLGTYVLIRNLMRSTTLPHDQQEKAFHFPMKADDLALISELDFAGACRSLVMRSRELNILGMSLRQCPEVGMHACIGDLFSALHDLFLLLSFKPVIRLIHSVDRN